MHARLVRCRGWPVVVEKPDEAGCILHCELLSHNHLRVFFDTDGYTSPGPRLYTAVLLLLSDQDLSDRSQDLEVR